MRKLQYVTAIEIYTALQALDFSSAYKDGWSGSPIVYDIPAVINCVNFEVTGKKLGLGVSTEYFVDILPF